MEFKIVWFVWYVVRVGWNCKFYYLKMICRCILLKLVKYIKYVFFYFDMNKVGCLVVKRFFKKNKCLCYSYFGNNVGINMV